MEGNVGVSRSFPSELLRLSPTELSRSPSPSATDRFKLRRHAKHCRRSLRISQSGHINFGCSLLFPSKIFITSSTPSIFEEPH